LRKSHFDKLATNQNAVQAMGDIEFRVIATELMTQVSTSATVDWTLREYPNRDRSWEHPDDFETRMDAGSPWLAKRRGSGEIPRMDWRGLIDRRALEAVVTEPVVSTTEMVSWNRSRTCPAPQLMTPNWPGKLATGTAMPMGGLSLDTSRSFAR
jgi:hypothetical protein